ncbi:hypothetical protein RGU41_01600 [Cryobacterium sp. 10C3]|nr:hypothetical protein [Cryobacterium sp. 10C3]MDY7555563.1 hypothetical protein [Cryobacterium sp. 10C3]
MRANAANPLIGSPSDQADEDVLEAELTGIHAAQADVPAGDEHRDGPAGGVHVGDGDFEGAGGPHGNGCRPRLAGDVFREAARGIRDLEDHLAFGVPGGELLDRPVRDHATVVENGDGVADPLDVGEDMRREEYGGPPAQRAEHLEHVAASHRVEGARRLVEEEQLGRVDQRLGDPEPLLHAAGVPADRGGHVGQSGESEKHADTFIQGAPVDREEPADEPEEFLGGHPVVEAGHVGQEADPSADRVVDRRDVAAEDLHAAARRPGEAGQHPEQRRLAGSVRAEEPEDRAFLDLEVDVVERAVLAVGLGQAAGADRETHRGPASLRGSVPGCPAASLRDPYKESATASGLIEGGRGADAAASSTAGFRPTTR